MQQTTSRVGLIAIGAAVVLGILGDALLRVGPWGINVVLYTLAIAIMAFCAARMGGIALQGGGRWLALPAILIAAAFAWHDSPLLLAGDFLVLLIVLALFADRARLGQLRIAGLIDYGLGILVAGIYALFGTILLLLEDVKWREARRGIQPGRVAMSTARAGVGALLATPLLLVFGALFASADANFAQLVRGMFQWDLNELLTNLFIMAFFAWVAAGFLRMALIAPPVRIGGFDQTVDRTVTRLGIIEVGTALGLLNVLFLAFVVLQFRYLFGGATALGYAEYARCGFFELVAVAALVLPVLLAAHALLRKDDPTHVRVFNVLSGLLVALLFVIMASALQRMALYVNEFGLTELRLYTTAFMDWLALLFVWFLLTVLRGKRQQFVFGGLATGLLVTLALNVLNPDYFIARTNVDRVAQVTPKQQDFGRNRELDASYLSSLSADALPVLLDALPNLPAPQRCRAAALILMRWTPPESPDWRTWNWSRAQAWQLVGAQQTHLNEIACPIGG